MFYENIRPIIFYHSIPTPSRKYTHYGAKAYGIETDYFDALYSKFNIKYNGNYKVEFAGATEKFKESCRINAEWYQKGYLTTQSLFGAYTSGLFTAQTGTKSYMSIGSSAGATHQRPNKVDGAYPFDVGIATIPQVSQSNRKVISQGPSVCIFKKDNAQEVVASWLFVKYLTTSVDFQAEFSMASGYVPVLKSVANNDKYKAFVEKADGGNYVSALSAKVCLEQESAYYTSPAFNGSSTARDQVGKLLAKCLTADDGGDVDAMIKKAFKDAIAECEY